MSDSSSEDDVPVQLLESVDKSFLNDGLFSKKQESDSKKNGQSLPPSLRPKEDDNIAFTETGLTKSSQSYVAKQLTKLLDKKLEKLITQDNTIPVSSNNKIKGGVSLFSDSADFLTACDESEPIVKKRKLKCKVNEVELEKRCKAVAVTPDWILSGTATKGWCKNTKGEVIHVKRKNSDKGNNVIECELIK